MNQGEYMLRWRLGLMFCADLPVGDKYSLAEIKDKISSERPNYKNRPDEQKALWMAEYEADKVALQREKRVNRKAEQLDAANTLKRVSTEVCMHETLCAL